MPLYILSKAPQNDGKYVVHDRFSDCEQLPPEQNRIDLDYHPISHSALLSARQKLPAKADEIIACPFCCKEYYTV